MSDPIKAPCKLTYCPAYHQDGVRSESSIKWIVIHSAEATSAQGVARYFKSSSAGGSTHLVLDDDECFRCLHDRTIPRGAPGANTKGFHIEQCGYARWSTREWMQHSKMLDRCAYKVAVHCRKFNIPPVFRTANGLRAGRDGITTHIECTRAFGGGSHWDPGPGWPREWFMNRVRYHLKRMGGS